MASQNNLTKCRIEVSVPTGYDGRASNVLRLRQMLGPTTEYCFQGGQLQTGGNISAVHFFSLCINSW